MTETRKPTADQPSSTHEANAFGKSVGNAPNPQTTTNQNIGGKVEDNIKKVQEKTSPSSLQSPSKEESDKATEGTFRKEEEKDGVTTVVSSVSEEQANTDKDKQNQAPPAINETQRLEGTPGNIDLTQGGTLNSDKSEKDELQSDVELQNAEWEAKAGPNPTPNRDGNERLRAYNAMASGGPNLLLDVDRRTNMFADELAELKSKNSLSPEDKDRLDQIEKQLRTMGRS